MPSIPIQPTRTYRATFALDVLYNQRYVERDLAAGELASLVDNKFLRGQQWEEFESPPVSVDITINDIKPGWELVNGRLIRKE